MTVDEFNEQRETLACIYNNCQDVNLDTRQTNQHIELFCKTCGRHQRYLGKLKQPDKRPKLKAGTVGEVWAASADHCAHCGLDGETLDTLGLWRTVQHVPPFVVNGHDGYLIPLCNWCQQHSASEMKRLKSLIERLAKKFDVR